MCLKLRFVLTIIALIAVGGCGGSGLVPLTGKVTLDGQPVSTVDIIFHNRSGGPSGYGNIQSDGTYVAKTGSQEGLKPGQYQITVRVTQPPEQVDRAHPKPRKLLSPERYAKPGTSGLSYTLSESGGSYDISLTSGP